MYRVIISDNKATYPSTFAEVLEYRTFNNLSAAVNFYVDELLLYKVKEEVENHNDCTCVTSFDCELVKIDGVNGNYVLDHRVFYISCE